MGACGSVPNQAGSDTTPVASFGSKKSRNLKNTSRPRHFAERHYVPFTEPQQLRRSESDQFNVIFLVQFSQFFVRLDDDEEAIFCNITWDYEQFQTSIISSSAACDARWEDHVFKYACHRKRLETAKLFLQVYDHRIIGQEQPQGEGDGEIARQDSASNYRLIGHLELPLHTIVNGPWRVDHCIRNVDGEVVGRLKFRCRVQPLQNWTLQIDNVHAYINRRQANHIVSVATALEVVHSARAECQIIGDDADESTALARGLVSARLDLLDFDQHESADNIARILEKHLIENGQPSINDQSQSLDCDAVCALDGQFTLVQFLETVMVWKIALPVPRREQAIIMHERRRSSTPGGKFQDNINQALALAAPADADTGDPMASLQHRRRATLGNSSNAPLGGVGPGRKPIKKARLSHRSLRRAPTISEDSESDMIADAAINMERIYSTSQADETNLNEDDLYVKRRAVVELELCNFGLEIGKVTMEVSFHEMNFHQQYNGCISEDGYHEEISKVERFSRRPSLSHEMPNRGGSWSRLASKSGAQRLHNPHLKPAPRSLSQALGKFEPTNRNGQPLWTPHGRHRTASGFKAALEDGLLPVKLLRLSALTNEMRAAFTSKSNSKKHHESMRLKIKECNAILAHSENDVLVSFFADIASTTVTGLLDATTVLLELFNLVNTMIDVMYDAKQRRKLMKTALRLIQRAEPYQAIELTYGSLHDEVQKSKNSDEIPTTDKTFLSELRSDVSFCVERFTQWRVCMVKIGTLVCKYVATPTSIEFPRASGIIGALLYRMPSIRNMVLARLEEYSAEQTAMRAAQNMASSPSARSGSSAPSTPSGIRGSNHAGVSPDAPSGTRQVGTPTTPFVVQHQPFRSSRASLNLRALAPRQILELMCALAEEKLNLRAGSSSNNPSRRNTMENCSGEDENAGSAEVDTGNRSPLTSLSPSTADFLTAIREEERHTLQTDPCYFWDRHEAVILTVITEKKLQALDEKLIRMASSVKKSRVGSPSTQRHGWAEALCTNEMTFSFVIKHWLCEVVQGMVVYHYDSVAGLSNTVVVSDSPSMKRDRPIIRRFLSKSHILPWESVPGYKSVIHELLWRLDSCPPSDHSTDFIDTVKYACANHQLVTPVVRTLFRRTSIYDTANVSTCLGIIDDCFASYTRGWTEATAFGHNQLGWLNASMFPLSFDYSFFFKALDVLLSSDNGQILWKTLGLLFRHWYLLTEVQANRLRVRIIKRHFFSVMTHWSPQGREFFISLMLFRISKPRDWEQTRAHGLSSRKRFMSSDSLASIGVDELDADHDLASKKKGTQARVKKVWINHAISIPKRSKSGRELWKAARIKLRGVTKWLLRDPEAVRASSTPLPFADSEGSGSPPPQPIEEQLSSIAMEDVTEQTSPEPIKDSNNSSGATDNGDNSVQQRPSLTDLRVNLSDISGERSPRDSSFRIVEETSLTVEISLELFDIAKAFLKSVLRHQQQKSSPPPEGKDEVSLENASFVVFRGSTFVSWYLKHPYIFRPQNGPLIPEFADVDDMSEDLGMKLAEKLMHAGFFFSVKQHAAAPARIRRSSATIRDLAAQSFDQDADYFSPELRRWEGWCYSYKVDGTLRDMGGISDTARLLCCSAFREFRRMALSRTRLHQETQRIQETKSSLSKVRSKKVKLSDVVQADMLALEDHLERSQDIITDLDTDPEINPPKQNRLCGGFGDDDPQYTEQELSTRLAEIDTAILSNALRPGDTTLWDSYLLRALMQWSETTDQVKQYMADPNAVLPEPTWNIEVHDEFTGATKDKLSV